MNASTRPIPNSTVSTTLPVHGRTKRSSVCRVSGQPISAASSFNGRTCRPDDARAVAPAVAATPTDSATASSCGPISRRYGPSRAISAACVPSSTTCPWSSTRMRSAPITLDSRCASTSVVRPRVSRSSACWISASFSASTDDSASSSNRIGASRNSARAIARRWRWPPDSMAALADARRVAVGQRRNEIVCIGGTRGGDHVRIARVGAAEPQVVGHAAVEQRRILRDDRDHLAHLAGIERTHVVAADADRAALRIVLAQQQAHDGRLARTARPDDRHRLAFAYREAQRRMRVRAAPRIREADGVERDLRPQARDARRIGGRCMTLRVEQRVDRIRRRLADHPLVQHGTQVAQRPEDFAAGHQHDQQRLKAHVAVPHAPRADRDRGGRAEAGAEIGEEPRQQAEREHPERAVGQRARLRGQLRAECRALPERLQRRQALHRVEELLAERLERRRACECRTLVGAMHELRQRERDERRDQQDRGRRHVPPREHREDHHRRARGDHELWQIGAEKVCNCSTPSTTDSITPPVRSPLNHAGPSAAIRSNSRARSVACTRPAVCCASTVRRWSSHARSSTQAAVATTASPMLRAGAPEKPVPARGRERRNAGSRHPLRAGRARRPRPPASAAPPSLPIVVGRNT